MKTIVAIDPGVSGGIAIKAPFEPVRAIKMPDGDDGIISFLSTAHTGSVCYLENIVKFKGKTPMSHMAEYAANWGACRGIARAIGLKVVIVQPKAWQKGVGAIRKTDGVSMEYDDWKRHLKEIAQTLYPGINVTLAIADALLILKYALTENYLDVNVPIAGNTPPTNQRLCGPPPRRKIP